MVSHCNGDQALSVTNTAPDAADFTVQVDTTEAGERPVHGHEHYPREGVRLMHKRQRMRPQLLPTHAQRLAEAVVPLRCHEPLCALMPPAPGVKHRGLHHAVEYEDAPFTNTGHPTTRHSKALYSWWGRLPWALSVADRPPAVTMTPGNFRVMDGDNMNRAMDRVLSPTGDPS